MTRRDCPKIIRPASITPGSAVVGQFERGGETDEANETPP